MIEIDMQDISDAIVHHKSGTVYAVRYASEWETDTEPHRCVGTRSLLAVEIAQRDIPHAGGILDNLTPERYADAQDDAEWIDTQPAGDVLWTMAPTAQPQEG